jgi:hypothetical protein
LATLLARYRQQLGDLDGTIRALDRAYAASPSFFTALDQAYFLVTAGLLEDARHYVDIAAATPRRSLFQWLERDRQIATYQDLFRDKQPQDAPQENASKADPQSGTQTPSVP